MSIEQYKTGLVRVVTGSTIVHGLSTVWNGGNVQESFKFKLDLDGDSSYTVATIITATQLQLSTSYVNASLQNQSYMITRSFTPYRSYARLYQGDSDAADIIRDQIVNLIDTDVGKIYNGTASLLGNRIVSSSGLHYWDLAVNATGEMTFSYNGTKKSHITVVGTWIEG